MDSFYLLAILISTFVFIIIPIFIIGLFYFILKKKSNKKSALTICLILLTVFAYFLITDFYPRDSFYVDNLKQNTELTLPKSARLIAKSGINSIYTFGDYNISYMYQFAQADYQNLYSQLLDKGFKHNDIYLETTEIEKLLSMTSNVTCSHSIYCLY